MIDVQTQIALTIDPPPNDWHTSDWHPERATGNQTTPVIMSGHQAGVWHPGILVKRLALEAAAEAFGAEPAWLIADQDEHAIGELTYPAKTGPTKTGPNKTGPNKTGPNWAVRTLTLAPRSRVLAGTPTCSMPRLESPADPTKHGPIDHGPIDHEGVQAIVREVLAAPGESAAEQMAAANDALLEKRLGLKPIQTIRGSELLQTPAGQELLERIAADPAACVKAYNAGVAAAPESRLRPLIVREAAGRHELPLWRIPKPKEPGRGEPRRPVFCAQLKDIDPAELAPRALLQTAIVRLQMADDQSGQRPLSSLFIHGTGGASYDRATDVWIAAWLPNSPLLAPIAMATATLTLDLGVPMASEAERNRAVWRAHAARHNPGLVEDPGTADRKRRLVEQIAAAPRKSAERGRLYAEMHALLANHARTHETALRALASDAARLADLRRDAAVAEIRTWPWPLYPDEALFALRDAVRAAFGLS